MERFEIADHHRLVGDRRPLDRRRQAPGRFELEAGRRNRPNISALNESVGAGGTADTGRVKSAVVVDLNQQQLFPRRLWVWAGEDLTLAQEGEVFETSLPG